MNKIIDVHAHLGDLLYPNGGDLIEKVGVKKPSGFELLGFMEQLYTWQPQVMNRVYALLPESVNKAIEARTDREGIARNRLGTRENLRAELDRYGIDHCVLLPVYPHVSFQDLWSATQKDNTLIPFTGPDFDHLDQLEEKLAHDVAAGAKGMKIHPILQKVGMDDERMKQVIEAFQPYDLPILFHTGYANYYLDPAEAHMQNSNFGEIEPLVDLVRAFPKAKFIVGHAALDRVWDMMPMFKEFENVWVDVSFQNTPTIKVLIETLGAEKVMYGSDWPWGRIDTSLMRVEKACAGDQAVRQRLFYDNAAELMRL